MEKSLNGDVYEGDFIDGKKHGKGTLKFRDGSIYTGEFQNDSINGMGMH